MVKVKEEEAVTLSSEPQTQLDILQHATLQEIYSGVLSSTFYRDNQEIISLSTTAGQITLDLNLVESQSRPSHQITIVMHQELVQIDFSLQEYTSDEVTPVYDNDIAEELSGDSLKVWRIVRQLTLLVLVEMKEPIYIDRTSNERYLLYKNSLSRVLEKQGKKLEDWVTFYNDQLGTSTPPSESSPPPTPAST